MAYIAPTSRTTGDLVTAAIWNADIVANEIAINAGAIAIASQAIGDLIVATSTTQLGRVADVATGQVLVSGGVATAPAYSASPSLTSLTLSSPLTVANGGSGRATATTAYAVLASGTTATGAEQSIAPSTSGFVLTDNGTGVLPSFQATAAPPLGIAEGRLTLTSATPVTTADVSAATTAYYTPYIGNSIALFDGSSTWTKYTFTEITISLVGLTASRPYDVFAYNNAGTVTIETLVWTNTTTRATALAYQNGVLVKSGATTRRYLGTIFINSTGGQTDDTLAKRFVWNMYNRVPRAMRVLEGTDSWTYTTATYRQANAAVANQLAIMCGVSSDAISVNVLAIPANTAASQVGGIAAIGEDSTSATATGCLIGYVDSPVAQFVTTVVASLNTVPAVGFHYYAWLEKVASATGTEQWRGDNGAANMQSGISGTWVS